VALDPHAAARVAASIVAIPPWSVMSYPADALARFLAASDGGASRYLVEIGGEEAGAVSVRFPWLKGPYLELLALLPGFQGQGIGASILAWFEQEGLRLGARNLWVCASSFNTRALRFYGRHGFKPAATLPGLVADGYDEILLRKFPFVGDR
jgi:diamine N-acetyltransferase